MEWNGIENVFEYQFWYIFYVDFLKLETES